MMANETSSAPGYRFLPTDLLLLHFLWWRSTLQRVLEVFSLIEERNLYDGDEPGKIFGGNQSSERYLFTPIKKKTHEGSKVERLVGNGTWRIQSTENIYSQSKAKVIGFKKMLNYIDDLRDTRKKSSWIMDEYTLTDNSTSYALCRIKGSRVNRSANHNFEATHFFALARDWCEITCDDTCYLCSPLQPVKLFGFTLPKQGLLRATDEALHDIFLRGFKFHPTDEELLKFYLRKKVAGEDLPESNLIHEQNLYGDEDPGKIWNKFNPESEVMYFFTPIKKKFKNGKKVDRKCQNGTWRIQRSENVFSDPHNKTMDTVMGFKKALNFMEDVSDKSMRKKSNWIMHEYTLLEDPLSRENTWAICRIRKVGSDHDTHDDYATSSSSRMANCEVDKVDAFSSSLCVTAANCEVDNADSQMSYSKRSRESHGLSTTSTLAMTGTDM